MSDKRVQRYFRHGTLTHMRVFEAVARLRSFTRAGEETHMAQPTVSVHMKKLAETVGARLVEQVGRCVRLTAAGEELYAACLRVFQTLGELDNALSDIQESNGAAHGTALRRAGQYPLPQLRAVSAPATTSNLQPAAGSGAAAMPNRLDAMITTSDITDELVRTDSDRIATLTLNRPQQSNVLSSSLIKALQTALNGIAADAKVRVVVIAGAGKAFCAGHDLKELRTRDPHVVESVFREFSTLMVSITRLPQPVIARVQGVAFAAGCQLVAQCDLAVASTDAQFATSGVKYGLFCNTPGVALGRNVGRKKAMQMLLTGDAIDAPTAQERGLVNRVVKAAELDAAIQELARSIIDKPPAAIAAGKRTFYEQLEAPLEQAYTLATQAMVCNLNTDDAAEGMDAFAGKRHPVRRGK
jgi:enoyl-CoA hydratase/carnithine racemase